jgi:hypothetical protein
VTGDGARAESLRTACRNAGWPRLVLDQHRLHGLHRGRPRHTGGNADTAIIDPIRDEFARAGFPVLTAEEVAEATVMVRTSAEPGAASVMQPGVGTAPYRFKGVPAAKTG